MTSPHAQPTSPHGQVVHVDGQLPLLPLPTLPGKVHEVRTCSVPRCEKKHVGHGYCGMHLYRWRRHGDPGEAERRQAPPLNGATCSIAGCSEPAQSRGWCNKHWLRWRRNGDPLVVKRDWTTGVRSASVTYSGAHMRVRSERGPASQFQCVRCDRGAQEWAYDHSDPRALVETRGVTDLTYSEDPAHYLPMCKSCHKRFDLEVRS